jgi:hypothetical protein
MLPGPFKFGKASLRQFDTLHPILMDIFKEAIKQVDFSILEGRRTVEQQEINVAKGVSKTLDSKHIPRFIDGIYDRDGYSHAADIVPYQIGINPWPLPTDRDEVKKKKLYRFYFLQGILYSIAHSAGIEIRQGIDWDRDLNFFDQTFDDMGHIELMIDLPKLKFLETLNPETAESKKAGQKKRFGRRNPEVEQRRTVIRNAMLAQIEGHEELCKRLDFETVPIVEKWKERHGVSTWKEAWDKGQKSSGKKFRNSLDKLLSDDKSEIKKGEK